ncbi:MAG: class E sortase [Dermatophilaceae bacterium]
MIRRAVGVFGELLVTLGVMLLLLVAWQLWWTDLVANRAQTEVVRQLEDDFVADPRPQRLSGAGVPEAIGTDGAFALLRIPRFGEEWARPVVEGTSLPVLERGIGHYPDSVGPGRVGNFAIAGHRTTYGRPFHNIEMLRDGDRVVVETRAQFFIYEVSGREIVRPTNTDVIAPVPGEPGAAPKEAILTMTSCHPKYSATRRYIVYSQLVDTVPRDEWNPRQWLST